MILEEAPQKVVSLNMQGIQQKNALNFVTVFADAFNRILNGEKLESVGDASVSIKVKNPLRPLLGSNWMEGQIIFIDNFENVIINIQKDDFEIQRKGRNFSIVFMRDEKIDKISETYSDVPEGEKLAHFNSAGYLEISINKGNAAGLLGLQGYSETLQQNQQIMALNSRLFYQTVKIFFD
jgi:S-adenosylmethionine hydrolase